MRKFASALVFLALTTAAAAQVPSGDGRRWAVVNLSVNFMREAPDYTAENGDQTLMGTVVEIVGEEGYWRQIVSPEPYKAWVNELGLKEMSADEVNAYIASPKYVCTSDFTHIFTEPSLKAQPLCDIVMGCLVRTVTDSHGKAVKKGRFLACTLPDGRTGWIPKADAVPFAAWAASRQPTGEGVVSTAMHFLGVPYMWGGTSIKAADCSGMALCAYFMNGILLPRNTSQQVRTGIEVSLDALEPGDLLFFGTPATEEKPSRVNHVGIYIGGGRFIHSSQVVRISSLDPAEPDYYERKPIHARRVIGHESDGPGVSWLTRSPWYFLQSE